MDYTQQIQELQDKLKSTDCFITRSELQGELEDLQVRYGIKEPPKDIEAEIGCGDSCSA